MAGVHAGWRSVALLSLAGFVAPLAARSQARERVEGARLFASSGCTQCHGVSGQGTEKGPSLQEVHRKLKPAQIQEQITVGGGAMPAFETALDAQQIRSLVAFLLAKHWVAAPPEPSTGSN